MTVIIGIDPHKATHMAVAIDGEEHAIGRFEVTADRAQTRRLLAWAAPLGEDARGRSSPPMDSASCCLNSCWPRVSTSSMCHPCWLHECGCWDQRRRRRTMATMRSRRRLRGCDTVGCGQSVAMTTRRCCDCWSAVTTTWSRYGPRRRAGCMPCCASSSPAARAGVCQPIGPRNCSGVCARRVPWDANAKGWRVCCTFG
jgi:hypothetical protein